MRRKLLLVFAINLFLLSLFLSAGTPARAQASGHWITGYTITNTQTNQILVQVDFGTGLNTVNAPILAGADLKVTFTVQVTASNPSTNLQLATNLAHSSIQGTFWQLDSQDYSGINGATYNPNQATVEFSQVIGTLVMECYGTVDPGITQSDIGEGITLHKTASFQPITLTDPTGNQLDQIEVNIVDSTIDQYNTLLHQAQNDVQRLQSNGVDPAFITLYQSVINSAQGQADVGFVDNAIGILNQLASTQSSISPISTNTPIESTLFLPVVGALAVIVVVMGYLFMKAREKVSYNKATLEDQIRDLEGITLRAQRIDKSISASLESIKERLKSIV